LHKFIFKGKDKIKKNTVKNQRAEKCRIDAESFDILENLKQVYGLLLGKIRVKIVRLPH